MQCSACAREFALDPGSVAASPGTKVLVKTPGTIVLLRCDSCERILCQTCATERKSTDEGLGASLMRAFCMSCDGGRLTLYGTAAATPAANDRGGCAFVLLAFVAGGAALVALARG